MPISKSLLIKNIIATGLDFAGFFKYKLKRLEENKALLLMYHRVLPTDQIKKYTEPGMYVTPESFRIHLSVLSKYFSVLPLQNYGSQMAGSKPVCYITFDDGWVDFYKYAFPILKDFNIPATVFLPTGFINTDRWFWTDLLGEIFLTVESEAAENRILNESIIHNILGSKADFSTKFNNAIQVLKKLPAEEIYRRLQNLVVEFNLTNLENVRSFMTWDEVRECAQSQLIDFGGHTINHEILTNLPMSEVAFEIAESFKELSNFNLTSRLSKISFCYPNGNYNSKIAQVVEKHGYSLAVTTEPGWVDSNTDLFKLNRIGLHEDISNNKSLFLARILEVF